MSRAPTARRVAELVLQRVARDAAYAAPTLSEALEQLKGPESSKERALATELVYGVLRVEPYLRRRIAAFGQPKESDLETWYALLVAAYQLDFLDRIPARAAVHEAVESVHATRDRRVGGFVNAVLRKVMEPSPLRKSFEDAILESAPAWLRKRLVRALGEENALRLLAKGARPRVTLRWLAGREIPLELSGELEAHPFCPRAYRWLGGGDPRQLSAYERGDFFLQEPGAQLIPLALRVEPGLRVLDACAGRGQKTAQLAESLAGTGRLLATDLHEHKLTALSAELARSTLSAEVRSVDWSLGAPEDLRGAFDRVLVDVPCTGTGTLRRRPEILRRLSPEDPARLRELQITILRHAAEALAPGGVLVYSTCSPLPEECEEVLARVNDLLVPLPFGPSAVAHVFPAELTSVRLLPDVHETDGYFVAKLGRVDDAQA